MTKTRNTLCILGTSLAAFAFAPLAAADDDKPELESHIAAEIVKQLKEVGLDEELIGTIEKEIADHIADGVGDLKVETKPTIKVEVRGDGEGAVWKKALKQARVAKDGKAKVTVERKAFVVGTDGKMEEIDLGEGSDKDTTTGIDAILEAMVEIDGEHIDIGPGAEDGVFGIGPAVIVGSKDGVEFDFSDLAKMHMKSGSAGGGKSVRAELDEIRAELAEQREMLEQILQAVKR